MATERRNWSRGRARSLILLLGLFSVVHQCDAEQSLADVTFEVIDSLGQQVDWATLTLDAGGPNGKREVEGRSVRVPFGQYLLRIEAVGFPSQEHRLWFLKDRIFVRVALAVEDLGQGQSTQVNGRIDGDVPKDQELWVRLVPLVRGNFADMDYKISNTKRFEFAGVPNGEYLLLALGGCPGVKGYPKLLAQEQISAWGRISVSLKLEGNAKMQACADRDRGR